MLSYNVWFDVTKINKHANFLLFIAFTSDDVECQTFGVFPDFVQLFFVLLSHPLKCLLQRGAAIVYATHIFDGLETWATHLVYIQDGELRRAERLTEVDDLKSSANLHSVVEAWLRSETKREKKKPATTFSQPQKTSLSGASPFTSSRHMAYYR